MTEEVVFALARDWAKSQGYRLERDHVAWLIGETNMPNWPAERMGWWYVDFSDGATLCGGWGPSQAFWVCDRTGEVCWVNTPGLLSWYQRFRRAWAGELPLPSVDTSGKRRAHVWVNGVD